VVQARRDRRGQADAVIKRLGGLESKSAKDVASLYDFEILSRGSSSRLTAMRQHRRLVLTLLAAADVSSPSLPPYTAAPSCSLLHGAELQPIRDTGDREPSFVRPRHAIAAFNTSQSEENFIWLGRRYAYLGDYTTAISTFSRGLAKYPQSYKLLRHRGHRYITTRNSTSPSLTSPAPPNSPRHTPMRSSPTALPTSSISPAALPTPTSITTSAWRIT
jgi:hypothetical protein